MSLKTGGGRSACWRPDCLALSLPGQLLLPPPPAIGKFALPLEALLLWTTVAEADDRLSAHLQHRCAMRRLRRCGYPGRLRSPGRLRRNMVVQLKGADTGRSCSRRASWCGHRPPPMTRPSAPGWKAAWKPLRRHGRWPSSCKGNAQGDVAAHAQDNAQNQYYCCYQ